MSAQHRQQPSRLFIPPMLNSQLANSVDTRTMFSPALHTAHQPGFPPLQSAHPFNPGFSLQTPVQPSFFHPPPSAPPRQMSFGHRPNGSIAHIPHIGMQPPIPMTPFGSQFPPQMMHGGGPPNVPPQPFVPKSRRTPSVLGGPPKALLGGPNRKVSPLPPSSQAAAIAEKVKSKKIPVKIPIESDRDGEGTEPSKKSLWSRQPVASSELGVPSELEPPEISSATLYPDDEFRKHLPPTVDVFLPSRAAWGEMKQREIDEKLEKLGIERRSEFDHPEAFNMRGRSASISSPADPALLMFKLNNLQRQQSASNSSSVSPHAHSASVSPNPLLLPRFQTHGHSMSLAQTTILSQPLLNRYSPVKPDSPVSEGTTAQAASPLGIYAPQGRVPAQLFAPSAPSRTESRPDFARGFGLDIPEEEEEELEAQEAGTEVAGDRTIVASQNVLEDNAPSSDIVQPSNVQINVAVPNEGSHTRHASRISVALSVGSTSKNLDETLLGHSRQSSMVMPSRGIEHKSEGTADVLNEWTGSESADGLSDDQESIGEWSNPSDEERARQDRLQRRYMRRMRREAEEVPRRLPEFPQPPEKRYILRNDDEDIISNPSDEGSRMDFDNRNVNGLHYTQALADPNTRSVRPLPPLPHSRDPSNQYSYYGSLPSQSPDHFTSGQMSAPVSRPLSIQHAKKPSLSKKELNPFAKPFVFGGLPGLTPAAAPPSVPASIQSDAGSPAQVGLPSHSRTPSFVASRKLNAAAQEFKPGAFTFRPPDGVPTLSFPEATFETVRPLPEPPVGAITRAVQGREKRQRTSLSNASFDSDYTDDEAGHDSMASFRFPVAPEPAMVFTRSAPTSPSGATNRAASTLNNSTKPGTFSGFSNLPPTLPPLLGQDQRSPTDGMSATDIPSINATRGSALGDGPKSPAMTLPNMQKQKRAPIPLDFKHPVSTNMVPAGLFKNLGTGDADVARNGRAQSIGMELSESRSDVSLDDLAMPPISRKATRRMPLPEDLDVTDDEFDGASNDGASHSGRTSEETQPSSPASRSSMARPGVASYSQGLRLEDRLESLLDHKIDMLRNDLSAQLRDSGLISSTTEELVREAMAMFRTQLRDSAAKGFGDTSMDANGELDFEMIRGIIEQGHEDMRKHIQDDLAMILKNIRDTEGSAAPESLIDLIRNVQDLRANVLASSAHVAERLDSIETSAPYKDSRSDREGLILDILSALRPHFAAIRSESIDYEALTVQLSQAVKPHITQLIDLASDKRETASLIVEQLMPVLQSIASSPREMDTGDLVSEISATVNRIIAPIDTYALKEQVADLVVERLDSRLATRDNDVAVNFETLKSKVTEVISPLVGHFDSLSNDVKALGSEQKAMFTTNYVDAAKDLAGLPEKLNGLTESLASVQALVTQQNEVSDARTQQLERIESAIGTAGPGEGFSKEQREEVLSINREVLDRLNPISTTLASALSSYETKHEELLKRLQSMDDTSQEVHRLTAQNTELQSQLSRARSQHGQIRVSNDNLARKVASVEEERDQLRTKVEELNMAALAQVAEFAALEARNGEQERAMHAALDRLKVSDVSSQTYQERIVELEKANRETTQENQQLKIKINRVEMQAEFAVHDKESTLQALKLLQEDRDRLAAQESRWEDFRHTAEQIENLTNLMSKTESEEMAELKRIRDQSRILEGEHAALKKRLKEQESKIATIERASATARQNLAQAQQRSAEWERKAREYEGEVERLTTALDQGEQTKNQLDADYSLAKLQLEERDAESRIVKDRERKLEEQVSALKNQISSLTSKLDEERKASRTASNQYRRSGERNTSVEREPSEPPTPRINGKSLPNNARSSTISPQPRTSTWDSMHAPRVLPSTYGKPLASRSQRSSIYNSRAPSPTPSTVSVVTQGEDGWYS